MESRRQCNLHRKNCPYHQHTSHQCYARFSMRQCPRSAPPRRKLVQYLPVCSDHRALRIDAGYCSVTQPCGFPCGGIFELKPLPDLQLCDEHRRESPCFLLQLPLELRYMIYSFVFPDFFVPAEKISYDLTSPRTCGILRVNRQISHEALQILYRQTQFGIKITRDTLSVLGQRRYRIQNFSSYFGSLRCRGRAQLIASFTECCRNLGSLLSPTFDMSPGTDSSAGAPTLWAHFPVPAAVWQQMRWFRLEIVLPPADPFSAPGSAVHGVHFLTDMVQRAVEYLEWNSASRLIVEVDINCSSVCRRTPAVQAQMIESVLLHTQRLWRIRDATVRLKLLSTTTPVALFTFDVLKDDIQILRDQSTQAIATLLEEIRQQMMCCRRETLTSLPKTTLSVARTRRVALYQLEAVIESLCHPQAYGLIHDARDRLFSTYRAAIQADHYQDGEAFDKACGQMESIVQLHAERDAHLNRLRRSVVQEAIVNCQDPNLNLSSGSNESRKGAIDQACVSGLEFLERMAVVPASLR